MVVLASRETMLQSSHGPLWTEQLGNAESLAIVLVHGAYQVPECWDPIIPALVERGYRVIRFALPGHGKSAPSAENPEHPVSTSDRVEALHAVLEAYQLEETGYVLVAWSVAGILDAFYRQRYGARGRKALVLVGSLLYYGMDAMSEPDVVEVLSSIAWVFAEPDAAKRVQGVRDVFFPMLRARPYVSKEQRIRDLNTSLDAALRGPFPFDPALTSTDEVVATLLHTPVLVLHGNEDAIFRPAIVARDVQRFSPFLSYRGIVCEGCGHTPFAEDSEGFLALLVPFLDEYGQ